MQARLWPCPWGQRRKEEITLRFPKKTEHFCCKRCPSMPGQEIYTQLEEMFAGTEGYLKAKLY